MVIDPHAKEFSSLGPTWKDKNGAYLALLRDYRDTACFVFDLILSGRKDMLRCSLDPLQAEAASKLEIAAFRKVA